jgi:hypothetical protein
VKWQKADEGIGMEINYEWLAQELPKKKCIYEWFGRRTCTFVCKVCMQGLYAAFQNQTTSHTN